MRNNRREGEIDRVMQRFPNGRRQKAQPEIMAGECQNGETEQSKNAKGFNRETEKETIAGIRANRRLQLGDDPEI